MLYHAVMPMYKEYTAASAIIGYAAAVALHREQKQKQSMNHPFESWLDNPECILHDQNHHK